MLLKEETFYKQRRTLFKEPDMLPDIVAMQYNLFATAAKIHSFNDFQETEQLSLIEPTPWPLILFPVPDHQVNCTGTNLSANYKMPGLFGFLRHFAYDSISGCGEKNYNISTGIIEKSTQKYTVEGTASYAMPVNDTQPKISIQQTTTYELIE